MARDLYDAGLSGDLGEIQYLCEFGADVNDVNRIGSDGYFPLQRACIKGHFELVGNLCEDGADVNKQGSDDDTPLHEACDGGHLEVVRYLCDHGADVNKQGFNHYSPLHRACDGGHLEGVRCLCEHGAEVNVQGWRGHCPLHWACEGGHLEVVRYLCDRGADVNTQDSDGYTPLHWACEGGHLEAVRYLCDRGADVNAFNSAGDNPLSLVVRKNIFDITLLLLTKEEVCLPKVYPQSNRKVRPVDTECELLLTWAVHFAPSLFLKRFNGATDQQSNFLFEVFQANYPLKSLTEQGREKTLQDLENLADEQDMESYISIKDLILRQQETFPSLQALVRGWLRHYWSKNGVSLLFRVKKFREDHIPSALKEYIFLTSEAIAALSFCWDGIGDIFSDILKKLIETPVCNKSKKQNGTIPPMTGVRQNLQGLHDFLTSAMDRASSRHCKITKISGQSTKEHEIDLQPENPFWILSQMALCCTDVINSSPALYNTSLSDDLLSLQAAVHVTETSSITQITCSIQKLLTTFCELLSEQAEPSWQIHNCGSFYGKNKVGEFDELDYLAILYSDHVAFDRSNAAGTKVPNTFRVSIPTNYLHGLNIPIKEYIHEGLKYYLQNEFRPDNPAGGRVYVRACYPHPRGPGVCIQFGWICEQRHTHGLGVDVSPVVCWPGKVLKDVWTPPDMFNSYPLSTIRKKIVSLPVYLIQDRMTTINMEGDFQITSWKLSFNHTKTLFFELFDGISPNIRKVFHLAKYIRDFLPRKMKHSKQTANIEGSWKSGSFISSYILFNILVSEVNDHWNQEDWSNTNIVGRMVHIIETLQRWDYIDTFKGIRESFLDIESSFSLNDIQKERFVEVMNRDIDLYLRHLQGNSNNTDYLRNLERFNRAHQYEEKVCVILPDPKTGEVSYKVYNSDRLIYDTNAIRQELWLTERAIIYYHTLPRVLQQLRNNTFYVACVALLVDKYELG